MSVADPPVPPGTLAGIDRLPHDGTSHDRVHAYPLPPFGAPRPRGEDPRREASAAFIEAIEKPLRLVSDDGRTPRYPYRIDRADRLASAFGAARLANRAAPLTPDLQVVLLTGHGSLQDVEEGMDLGAFQYVMKPVNIDDLVGILRAASAQDGTADDE